MHIDNVILESMLRAYQEELINELVYYKEDFIDNTDLINDTENIVKSIDRVLDNKEKIVFENNYKFD